jgi:argininosuccinate lyase
VALDVAEALVKKGVPFREAHEAVGRLVAALGETPLGEATGAQLADAHALLEPSDIPTVVGAAAGRGSLSDQAVALRAACGVRSA